MTKRIVVLHSGGLDSTIMLELAKSSFPEAEVIPCYINIGHDYAWKEIDALPSGTHVHPMEWIEATGREKSDSDMKSIFIPGRNALLAMVAAAKYCPDEIWLGALMGEIHQRSTDKNEKFRSLMNELLEYVFSPFEKQPKLVFPFVERRLGKLGVTKLGLDMGMKDQILASSSCMSGESGNCGICGVCLRRAGIFMQLGLEEPYNRDPWSSPENRKMISEILKARILSDESHYDCYRQEEIIPALQLMHPGKNLLEIYEMYKE
jgi:7-cyano-7-deazaguanine synthase in queuosine biosynthesis